jgi:hypothetical protein
VIDAEGVQSGGVDGALQAVGHLDRSGRVGIEGLRAVREVVPDEELEVAVAVQIDGVGGHRRPRLAARQDFGNPVVGGAEHGRAGGRRMPGIQDRRASDVGDEQIRMAVLVEIGHEAIARQLAGVAVGERARVERERGVAVARARHR